MGRVAELVQFNESKEEFINHYRRNREVRDNYQRNADKMTYILEEMEAGAMQRWGLTKAEINEDLG